MWGGEVHTSISITGEIASPLNECLSFVVAGGNGEEADGAHDAGVAELGLGGDDGVSNVVINCLPSPSSATFHLHYPDATAGKGRGLKEVRNDIQSEPQA